MCKKYTVVSYIRGNLKELAISKKYHFQKNITFPAFFYVHGFRCRQSSKIVFTIEHTDYTT